MQRFVLWLVAVVALGVAPASGQNVPVDGAKLVAKSAPKTNRPRFLFKSASTAITDLSENPAAAGSTVAAFEASCSGAPPDELCGVVSASGSIALDAFAWEALGNPPGSRGYRYRDSSGAQGGVKRIVYKEGKLIIKAVGASWPWEPAGGAELAVVRFTVGDRTYCSEFGGTTKADEAGFLSLRNAPAPAECRALCGDGQVEGTEACDPPDGLGCDASCQSGCAEEATNTLVACTSTPFEAVGLAANTSSVLAAFAEVASPSYTYLYARRLDASLQAIDIQPLLLSPEPEPEIDSVSSGAPQAIRLGSGFRVAWSGSISAFGGAAFANYFGGRNVPSTGPLVEDATIQELPPVFGQCNTAQGDPRNITSNLSGTGIHATSRVVLYCPTPFYEYIAGVPIAFEIPPVPPVEGSSGGAPLATGSSAVAAVWWNLFLADIGSPTESSLKAGWIEPAPQQAIVLTPHDPLVAKSASPALAANGDLFLAVWTIATAAPPAVATEVRGMRFTRSLGPLDPSGGFLIASGSGEALLPAVAGDGDEFVVAWREAATEGTIIKAMRVANDGSLVDPAPIDVAASGDEASLAVAANASAHYVGFTRLEDNGLVSIRVATLP